MVVEDNRAQLESVVELISGAYPNVEVASATSGSNALALMADQTYDMVVLDLELTDYNRFEFIDVIRDQSHHKEVPIIVYTGREISRDDERSLRDRVSEIVIKGDQSSRRLLQEIELFTYKTYEIWKSKECSVCLQLCS